VSATDDLSEYSSFKRRTWQEVDVKRRTRFGRTRLGGKEKEEDGPILEDWSSQARTGGLNPP
jgi:hypothetical protein